MTQERVEDATRSFLDDNPEQEDTLETLLERERTAGVWAFEDAPADSGEFGELVSRDFVERTDAGDYRFADRQTVAAVLDGDAVETHTASAASAGSRVSLPEVDTRALSALVGALAVVVAVRSLFYTAVFRGDHIVSPGNDPYFYRYWQARLLEQANGAADASMLATVGEQTRLRPLTHALNWWFAELLGGTQGAADLVAAFQPLLATLALALALYWLAHALTGDHRIALASVFLLALTPVHVVYTAVGFLEHRPYQYLWIGVMAVSIGWLAVDVARRHREGAPAPGLGHVRTPRAWGMAAVLAVGVAGIAHSWGGSPLSFLPVAVYLAGRVVADCRERIDPLLANGPALAGLGAGSLLALVAHLRWGWHDPIAATIPVVVAVGGVAVAGLATLWYRLDAPLSGLLAAEGVIAVVGTVLFWQLRPGDVARLQERSDALFARETATETASLFTTEHAIVFGPLTQVGIGFYLALIPLGVATYYVTREYEPAWLAAVCFAWFYLVLALIQVRFAAQFSIFCALFGAVGLVYLLGALDLARTPTMFDRRPPEGPSLALPETPTLGAYLVGVLAVALLLNLIFVPSLLAQTQYSDEQYEAATIVDDHANELDREYPQNYVLSEWGDARMYNYFVSGESQGYGYARSNYVPFVADSDPDAYYDQFSNRVGYVVLTETEAPDETVQAQLFEAFGAGEDSVSHYQLLYAAGEVRLFALVEGARIQLETDSGATVTAKTTVETAGEHFEYERTATTEERTATVRVAYPGTYEIDGETVRVSEAAVYEGQTVTVERTESE